MINGVITNEKGLICANCGKIVADSTHNFCFNCGNPLNTEAIELQLERDINTQLNVLGDLIPEVKDKDTLNQINIKIKSIKN